MSNQVTITRNGMKVDCFGKWKEDSNCLIVGDWASGDEMEEIWAGDGWPADKEMPKNWTEVVEHLTAWAKQNGHEIMELQSC